MFSIYCHTNNDNGKKYIGITSQDPKHRWLNGTGYKNNEKFYKDIKEYGWNNFSHDILADGLTQNEAVELEEKLIAKYNTVSKGYNNSSGGRFVKKCALCHEANLIKQGLKASPLPWLNEWVQLFEEAERAGEDSALLQNLNIHCSEITRIMRENGEGINYGDAIWLTDFIGILADNARKIVNM